MSLFLFAAAILSIAPVQPREANRQPQLAAAPDLTALAFGSGHSIWFSASRDEGQSFSQPSKVADLPQLALGRHRGPRIAISGKTIIISAVLGNAPSPEPRVQGAPIQGDLVA